MDTHTKTITAYHGSGCSIERFDFAFTNQGADQNGSGFYFTTKLQEAIGYTEARTNGETKPGGEESPTVHVAELSFERLMPHDATFPITRSDVTQILRHAPDLRSALENWADIDHEGMDRALALAVPSYVHRSSDGRTIRTLFKIANDFFSDDVEAFNRAIKEVFGIDGVVEHYEGYAHYVAFFPEQVRIIERLTPDAARERLAGESPTPSRPRHT